MTKRELRKRIEELERAHTDAIRSLERRIEELEARPIVLPYPQVLPMQPYPPNYTGDPLPPWPIITC